MNASSHCRTSVFEKEFKFQYVRGDIRIHITTHYFDIFLKVTLCLAVEIWKSSLTFGTEILFELLACMHYESTGSFKDESCTIGYISQLD